MEKPRPGWYQELLNFERSTATVHLLVRDWEIPAGSTRTTMLYHPLIFKLFQPPFKCFGRNFKAL